MMPIEPFDVFLSYSKHDLAVVRALAQRLKGDGLRVWFDEWEVLPGDAIFSKLEEGLENAKYLIFFMSAYSIGSDWAQLESQTMRFRDPLNRNRQFIPLRLDDVVVKGSLAQLQAIDWRKPADTSYQTLLRACGRAVPAQVFLPAAAALQIDVDRIIKYAPQHLLGRAPDSALLKKAWQRACNGGKGKKPRPHIISFVALGGEGKTSLVAHWVKQLWQDGWPGCEAVFAWSFYSQGSDDKAAASSDLFIHTALRFFGEAELAASSQSAVEKARKLAQVVGARRVLLVLDGVEPLQYAPTGAMNGKLKDEALAQLLRGLALQNRGLCVLTTRYSIPDLQAFWDSSAPEHKLLRLSKAAGVALLRKLKVHGAQAECEKLVESVKGHALSVHLFGSFLRDAHGGDVRQRDRVRLAHANVQEHGGHAFRVMDAYVSWLAQDGAQGRQALGLLNLLGLFDRPADAGCLGALLQAPSIAGLTDDLIDLDEAQRNLLLTRLQDAGLLTVHKAAGQMSALDAHPLLRRMGACTLICATTLRIRQNRVWMICSLCIRL